MSNGIQVQAWRQRTKAKLVELNGGRCWKCGYAQCMAALQFHHRNPHDKKFSIASALARPMKWSKIVEEASKCVLLCNRCHVELHAGLWNLEEIEWRSLDMTNALEEEVVVLRPCPHCGTSMKGNGKFCSLRCSGAARVRIVWPTPQELEDMLRKKNRSQVAAELGVSDAAVIKHEKKVGIYRPRQKRLIPR